MPAQGAGFRVTVDYDDYKRLVTAVTSVRSSGILLIYRDFYQAFRPVLRSRYDRVSAETEYSKKWQGTKQEYSGLIRGETALWGQDSGALYQDLTNNVKITNVGIEVFSDLPYAGGILNLMASKGPFAPYGIFFLDSTDLDELEEIIQKRMRQFLGLDAAT